MMFGQYGDHISGWGWFAMSVGVVLFWAVVITAIVLLVRYLGHTGERPNQPPTAHAPEQMLAERFARGEIDETEYRQRLATLH
jgi:putative membrane protein